MTTLIRPAESAHWYGSDGQPHYEIECKSNPGTYRPTTLRDAKSNGWVPSVTSVLQLMAKPGLEAWKSNNIVLSALTLPRFENEPIDKFAERIVLDAAETAKKAAELGTNIHAAIQAAFEGDRFDNEYIPYVSGTKKAMNDIWSA